MLQRKHSAILWTFIKLPFVIKIFALSIFEWSLKIGFTVRNMLPVSYYDILCLVEPDLGPNCLQRLSGDDTSSQRDKTWIQTNPMQPSKYMRQCNTTLEPSH